jgi:Fe-S cluster assembly ATP-binding protein
LEAELAMLDEVDSGLDIDAMREVAEAVNGLRAEGRSLLLITHYRRMLDMVVPDKVHVMQDGEIVSTGGPELAQQIEKEGYTEVGGARE